MRIAIGALIVCLLGSLFATRGAQDAVPTGTVSPNIEVGEAILIRTVTYLRIFTGGFTCLIALRGASKT